MDEEGYRTGEEIAEEQRDAAVDYEVGFEYGKSLSLGMGLICFFTLQITLAVGGPVSGLLLIAYLGLGFMSVFMFWPILYPMIRRANRWIEGRWRSFRGSPS